MKKLNVGVIGCGVVAQQHHIPNFLKLRDRVVFKAVCDMDQKLAKSVADRFHIPSAYSDFSDMLSKEKLDVVTICTSPQLHEPMALEAMENHCHVLVEKPMALSVSGCNTMIGKSKKLGVKLSVVHNKRFLPPFTRARQMVENGLIGELSGMRFLSIYSGGHGGFMAQPNHWVHGLPGGVVGEIGPHPIYMSLVFLGNIRSVDVCAKKNSNYPWVSYTDYRIELEGEKINSSIYLSLGGNYLTDEVDIFGTEYKLGLDLQTMLLLRYRRGSYKRPDLVYSSLVKAGQIIKGVTSNSLAVALGKSPTFRGHDILIGKFVDSVVNDKAVPVPPEEGRETARIIEIIAQKLDLKYGSDQISTTRIVQGLS